MSTTREVGLAIHAFFNHNLEHLPTIEVAGVGILRPGFALDQVQICPFPSRDMSTLLDRLVRLNEVLFERGYGVPVYRVVRDMGKDRKLRQSEWDKTLTQSLVKPLYAPDEFAGEARQLIRLADFGFTVVDFDVTKFTPEAQLLRLNLLNLVAPAVLDQLHRKRWIVANQDKRHELWRYAENKARVPLGWSWHPDMASYLRNVLPLRSIFALREERAGAQFVFPDGLFHHATLVAYEGRTVIRFSALPTLPPHLVIYFVRMIDCWLVQAVKAVGSHKPRNAEEATRLVRCYERRPIPWSDAERLYICER